MPSPSSNASSSTPQRHQSKTKMAFIAITMMLGIVFLLHLASSSNSADELRSEFKKDMDSLRSDVDDKLEVHLLATAAVKEAKELASQSHNHCSNDIVKNFDHSLNISDHYKDTPQENNCDLQDAAKILHQLSSMCIAAWDWSRDVMICLLRPVHDFSLDWIQQEVLDPAKTFANQTVDIAAWFVAFLLTGVSCLALLLFLLNRFVKKVPSKECFIEKNCSGANQKTEEHFEDDALNTMYQEAVTANLKSPVRHNARSPNPGKKLSKQERLRQARARASEFGARDLKRIKGKSRVALHPTMAMRSPSGSKKERLKQAKANAQLFGEQDMQRIQNAKAKHQ